MLDAHDAYGAVLAFEDAGVRPFQLVFLIQSESLDDQAILLLTIRTSSIDPAFPRAERRRLRHAEKGTHGCKVPITPRRFLLPGISPVLHSERFSSRDRKRPRDHVRVSRLRRQRHRPTQLDSPPLQGHRPYHEHVVIVPAFHDKGFAGGRA